MRTTKLILVRKDLMILMVIPILVLLLCMLKMVQIRSQSMSIALKESQHQNLEFFGLTSIASVRMMGNGFMKMPTGVNIRNTRM